MAYLLLHQFRSIRSYEEMVIDGASLLLELSHAIVSQDLFTPNGTVERMVKKLYLYT